MRRGRSLGILALIAIAFAVSLQGGCGPADGERKPIVDTWEDSTPKCEGELVYTSDGWQKDGSIVFYDRDGRKTSQGSYERGVETGPWTEWLEDGSKAEGQYVDGARHGPWTYWHENGTKQEIGRYAAGQREGVWTWWYSSGAKRAETEYRGNARSGRTIEWRPDGTVDAEKSGVYDGDDKVGD